jgi:hypothetical protein
LKSTGHNDNVCKTSEDHNDICINAYKKKADSPDFFNIHLVQNQEQCWSLALYAVTALATPVQIIIIQTISFMRKAHGKNTANGKGIAKGWDITS